MSEALNKSHVGTITEEKLWTKSNNIKDLYSLD